MPTPRCFIARHGETEWSLSGKHTGTSDIPLTSDGEKRVRATGKALVGPDRLIVPSQLKHIYVSPRSRAQRTLELLDLGCHDPYPWQVKQEKKDEEGRQGVEIRTKDEHVVDGQRDADRQTDARVTVTELIREWDYGDYEGITSAEIRARRKKAGLDEHWDIWRDGCPGGESPADVTARVDTLIAQIREDYHGPVMGARPKGEGRQHGDVLVVAHGHILRAFAMRWIGASLERTHFIMDAGGVGTLSYEHHSIEEPAILLGGGFVVGE